LIQKIATKSNDTKERGPIFCPARFQGGKLTQEPSFVHRANRIGYDSLVEPVVFFFMSKEKSSHLLPCMDVLYNLSDTNGSTTPGEHKPVSGGALAPYVDGVQYFSPNCKKPPSWTPSSCGLEGTVA
jgi:hypothetical protein